MAQIITVTDLTHPGLSPYARLTERQLRSKRFRCGFRDRKVQIRYQLT